MTARNSAIEHVRNRLLARTSPRLHMSAIIAAAGAIGFLVSYFLLARGVTRMAMRYPIAVAAAYLAFLGMLALWLRRFRLRDRRARDRRTSDRDSWSAADLDIVNVPVGLSGGGGDVPADKGFGGGGGFAGGGASRSFTGGEQVSAAAARPVMPATGQPARASVGGPGSGGGFGFLDSLDEGAWVLFPVAIAAALTLGAVLYVVYIAPILLAELLLDAALAAGLYHRLRTVRGRHWVRSAVQRTMWPAIIATLLLGGAGALMQAVYPNAVSIGRVWEAATRPADSGGVTR